MSNETPEFIETQLYSAIQSIHWGPEFSLDEIKANRKAVKKLKEIAKTEEFGGEAQYYLGVIRIKNTDYKEKNLIKAADHFHKAHGMGQFKGFDALVKVRGMIEQRITDLLSNGYLDSAQKYRETSEWLTDYIEETIENAKVSPMRPQLGLDRSHLRKDIV